MIVAAATETAGLSTSLSMPSIASATRSSRFPIPVTGSSASSKTSSSWPMSGSSSSGSTMSTARLTISNSVTGRSGWSAWRITGRPYPPPLVGKPVFDLDAKLTRRGYSLARAVRAVQISEWGGPEVLEVVDLPVPEPAADEVLIEVSRAGLNYADTHRRRNSYVAKAELPLVPGAEVAGVRTDTGERVVALCGTGGYAQYATAPAALTFPIPDGVDDGQALALLVQGLTAFHLYRTSAQIRPGESVVVHAAAGGVGSLAVQLGKPMGAGRVIATASTEDKRALALELGADAAVDASPEGMADRLVQANLGEPVDVVLEVAGGRVFDGSLDALAPFGRVVVY